MHLAGSAAADQFTTEPAMLKAALLRAVLENALLFVEQLAASQVLFDAHAERLLHVYVLAGPHGGQGVQVNQS